MAHVPRRGMVPMNAMADPIVNRRDERVSTMLSKPSPLHAVAQTAENARLDAASRRIRQAEVDDGDDDLAFIERLTAATHTPVAVPFPFPKPASVTDFREETVLVTATGGLNDLKADAFVEASVWRSTWWTAAGAGAEGSNSRPRVVVNILRVRPLLESASPISGNGAMVAKIDVEVDIVTAEITQAGLATGRIIDVVAKKPRDDADGDNVADSEAVPSASGVLVELKPPLTAGASVGFGRTSQQRKPSANNNGVAQHIFVRTEPGLARGFTVGQVAVLMIEAASGRVVPGHAPRKAEGEWTLTNVVTVFGDAPAATPAAAEVEEEVDEDDVRLVDLPSHSAASQQNASPNSKKPAPKKPAPKKPKAKRSAYDIELTFTPDPESQEAKAEHRRLEAIRAAKQANGKRSRH